MDYGLSFTLRHCINPHVKVYTYFKSGFVVSLILFFTFGGAESALNVGGEMKNPRRTAPVGLLSGLLVTITIFCLVQLVAQSTLGGSLATYKEAPMAEVARVLMGSWAQKMILIASSIALLGILISLPLVFPRVMFAGAENKVLPAYLAKVHPRFSTPANAIITFAAIAWIVAISGGFRQLALIVSASLLILYTGVVLATIKFRFKKDIDLANTFRIPGGLTVHIAALIALGWFIFQLQVKELAGTIIFVAVLSAIYLFRGLRKNIVHPIETSISEL